MVARTPLKERKMMFPQIDPTLLKETVNKVDKCMARLQELQYTISGGSKMVYGVSLSPRSTKGYLRTSLRCKQESLRIKNANPRKSSPGKMPTPIGEWQRMSLPAMLVGETVGEILKASHFVREITTITRTPVLDDPKTPVTVRRKQRMNNINENSELRTRRRREKHVKQSASPVLRRARSRINFKASSPIHLQDKENSRFMANRVSPRHKPWAKKAVLFPNPLFHTSPTSNNPRFCKTKSPIITTNRPKTPHKFLIKTRSPPSSSKFQVKRVSPPPVISLSPSRLRRSPVKKTSATGTAARLRRSFSPSRLANRLISPLKTRKGGFTHKTDGLLKHKLNCTPIRLPIKRI